MSLQTKTFSANPSTYYTLKLTLTENSTSVANNTSEISYKLVLTSGASNFSLVSHGYNVMLNGVSVAKLEWESYKNQISLSRNSAITLCSGTTNVTHDDDGSLNMDVAFSLYTPTDTTPGSVSVTGKSMELTTIPRASEPTVSTDPATMGSQLTIYTNRESTAFTHSLHYTLDGGDTWHDIGYGVTDSCVWTPPIELAISVPNDSKFADFGIMCRTYNGSTQVGDKWVYVDLIVPENEDTKPTVSATASPNNNDWLSPENTKYDDFKGLYIQGMSKVDVSIIAEGKLNTNIGSYSTTLNSKTYSGDTFISDTLTSFGTLTIDAKATDGREISNTDSLKINVISYSKPLVVPINGKNIVVCSRCDEEGNLTSGGTSLKISAKRSFYPVLVDDIPVNTCTLYCAVKQHNDTDYGPWITLISGSDSNTNEYNSIVPGVVLDINKMYDICITACDDLGNWDTSVEFTIPTEETPLDLADGGLNVAIGRRAKKDASRSLDCGWDAYFEKGIYLGQTHLSEEQLIQLLNLLS